MTDERLKFRKPSVDEAFSVYLHYVKVIKAMQDNGIDQWDELYPNAADISADIYFESLWIGEKAGKTVCAFSVNSECEPEYASCLWQYPNEPYFTVHRLAVAPEFQRHGFAVQAMSFIDDLAKEKGIKTIRLDTFCGNPAGVALYKSLDFKIVGYAHWRKGKFQIMEKVLQ